MKKSGIISIVAACLMLTTAFAAACTDGGNEVAAGEVVMEAEGIDLSELSGRGYSNEAKGCGMIMGLNTKYLREDEKISKSISNGYFVGYFNTADTTMTFEFTSDQAVSGATMKLRLGSEYGTLRLDPSSMTIAVNGTELDYDKITVTGAKVEGANIRYGSVFKDYEVSVPFDLLAGSNKIELTILQNTLGIPGMESVGPGVDCIKVKSDSKLTFTSLWEQNKEEISVDP